MKQFIIFLYLISCVIHQTIARSENDSIFQILQYELNRKGIYTNEKEEQIRNAKQLLYISNLSLNQIYALNREIYIAYRAYQTDSAICDIKNAIKENTSLHALALILFQEGNIDLAYKYIQSSIDDAIFCNARFRTYEISQIFPIIDGAYQAKSAKQKRELQFVSSGKIDELHAMLKSTSPGYQSKRQNCIVPATVYANRFFLSQQAETFVCELGGKSDENREIKFVLFLFFCPINNC
jgi:hypothetical protein